MNKGICAICSSEFEKTGNRKKCSNCKGRNPCPVCEKRPNMDGSAHCSVECRDYARNLSDSRRERRRNSKHSYTYPLRKSTGGENNPWQDNAIRNMEGD